MKADATQVLATNYVVVVLSQFVCMQVHVLMIAKRNVSCGREHMARSCLVWQREEIVSVKYREGLSFQDARKVVNSRRVIVGFICHGC